jgi:hypothetical protein
VLERRRARSRNAERHRRWYARAKAGLACHTVTVDWRVYAMLLRYGYVRSEAELADKKAVDRALSKLLELASAESSSNIPI